MSQPNQFTSEKALTTKARTTQALAAETASQSVIKSSDSVRAVLNQQLYKSQVRLSELDVILQAFEAEKVDENVVRASVEAALKVLETYPQVSDDQ